MAANVDDFTLQSAAAQAATQSDQIKWHKLALNDVVPKPLFTAADTAVTALNTFLQGLSTVIAEEKLILNTIQGDLSIDVLAVLIKAIDDVIEGLLLGGKVHVLFVPIPKSISGNIGEPLPITLQDMANGLGFDFEELGTAITQGANQSYTTLSQSSTGGNSAFFRTVAQSLYDRYDPNRPQYFSPGDAVACQVILLGSASLADGILSANALNRLFRPEGSLAARLVPVPQNVHVQAITVPGSVGMGVEVAWDPPPLQFTSPYFPSVTFKVTDYAVIRSTERTAPNARSVLDLIGTKEIVEGSTNGGTKILKVGSNGAQFDPGNAVYVDTEKLDSTKTYYYCVAWRVSIFEGPITKLQETFLNWEDVQVSAVRKVVVRRIPPDNRGTPPDWEARGSLVDIMPPVALAIRKVKAKILALASRSVKGPAGDVSQGLDILQKNIDQLAARAAELAQDFVKLRALLNVALPGLYTTGFFGIGGNAFLLSELAKRLNDRSDSSRPPFDSNEYVIGLVLVAGGPRLPDIQPVIDMFDLFFGAPQNDSPLFTALSSLDGVVSGLEVRTFDQGLQNPVVAPDGQFFDASLSPTPGVANPVTTPPQPMNPHGGDGGIDALTGLPYAPAPPTVINNSGVGIDGSDPSNPDASFTNRPDPNKDPCC